MKKILIKADTNDADFVSKLTVLSEADVPLVRKVAALIAKQKGHNWDTSGEDHREKDSPESLYGTVLTEEEIEVFNDFVPSAEYGVHTIYKVTILEVISEEDILS